MQNTALTMVAVSLLLGLGFVLSMGAPWRSLNPPMAWLQSGLAWVAVGFDTLLLLSGLGVILPAWSVLLVLLSQDVVFAWRLWWLVRARRPGGKLDGTLRETDPDEGSSE